MTDILPVPVLKHPHWRVNIRPESYRRERVSSLADCRSIIEGTKVTLRGWDYPHLSRKPEQNGRGNDYVESWSDFMGHVEYWRFFQSGQFLHLFAIREAMEPQWADKLKKTARWHLTEPAIVNAAPGFFSLLNFVYTVTEIFEFASRLWQRGIAEGPAIIDVRIRGAKGFGIIPDFDRAWSEYYPLGSDDVGHAWIIEGADLIAATGERALDATLWFFDRFGWPNPPREIIARDQAKFLRGRL